VGKQQAVDLLLGAKSRNDVTRRKGQVKKNRLTLRLLTGAVCSLADHELPFRSRDESATVLNKGHFVIFLNVLKKHGPLRENRLNLATFT